MMVSIGYVLSHEQFSPLRLLDIGVAAERAGFDMVWTSDHFHPWMDNQGHAGAALVTLAALGQKTEQLPFGTGVTCPTYRYNPAVVAQSFASLGVLYPSRVFLGVGTGEALNEQPTSGEWGDYDERAERFEEALQIIRSLWQGGWVSYPGKYYKVKNAKIYDLPDVPVPLYVAASGKESAEIAGKYGDGWITDSKSLTDPEIKSAFEKGARDAGKDPATLSIHVESFVHVGDEESAKQVASLWRFLPNGFTEYIDDPDPRSIQQRAEREVTLEQVLEEWTVGPDAQTHISKTQELMDAGATHLYIHSAQEDQQAVIDFYAQQVLPKFQHERLRAEALQVQSSK